MEKKKIAIIGASLFQDALILKANEMGIETHVCEQQTVLDLLGEGVNVYVPADCVASRKDFDRDVSIERMRAEGAVITTYESILFEILRGSKEEGFKSISNLVK